MPDDASLRGCGLGFRYFTEMCSGSEAGSYLRLIDFVYHSTLGSRVMKKKKRRTEEAVLPGHFRGGPIFSFFLLLYYSRT